MKKNILIVTGACGVGKSTIASAWAKKEKGVCIECDYFTEWIYDNHPISTDYFLDVESLVVDLSWACAERYIQSGFSVAMENVWSPNGFRLLREKVENSDWVEAYTFVHLKCDLTENVNRDHLRSSDNQMKERVRIVKSELEAYTWQDFVHTVDTTSISITETLEKIVSLSK